MDLIRAVKQQRPEMDIARQGEVHKHTLPHEAYEMYFVKRCNSQRRALTPHSEGDRLCYAYNGMGVQGQHADVAGVVMYLEEQPTLLFGALMSILRRGRLDVGVEKGMVRVPATNTVSEANKLRAAYAHAAAKFGVPDTALPGLHAMPATPDDEPPPKALRTR